jgi:hypothetical protein
VWTPSEKKEENFSKKKVGGRLAAKTGKFIACKFTGRAKI